MFRVSRFILFSCTPHIRSKQMSVALCADIIRLAVGSPCFCRRAHAPDKPKPQFPWMGPSLPFGACRCMINFSNCQFQQVTNDRNYVILSKLAILLLPLLPAPQLVGKFKEIIFEFLCFRAVCSAITY